MPTMSISYGPDGTPLRDSPYNVTTYPPSRMSLSASKETYRKFYTRDTCERQVRIIRCAQAILDVLNLSTDSTTKDFKNVLWRLGDQLKELELFTGMTPVDIKSLRWVFHGDNKSGLAATTKSSTSEGRINKFLELCYCEGISAVKTIAEFLCNVYAQELAVFKEARGDVYPIPPCLVALQTAAASSAATRESLLVALANICANLSAETNHYPTTDEMNRDEWWYGRFEIYCNPGEKPDLSRGIGHCPGIAPWDLPPAVGAAYVKCLQDAPLDDWNTTFDLPAEFAPSSAPAVWYVDQYGHPKVYNTARYGEPREGYFSPEYYRAEAALAAAEAAEAAASASTSATAPASAMSAPASATAPASAMS